MEKITSKEIAKLAGVSVSTVSIVLNNKPGVGMETREKVLDILSDHGIFPKSIGVSTQGTIRFCKIVKHGNIINDRHNVFISEYIDGVVEEAKQHDYSVEVSTYNGVPIQDVAEELSRSVGLFGCILLSTELSEEDIQVLSSIPIPHVFLDALYMYKPGAFVTMDNHSMVFQAIEYLKACGHKKIGMLNSVGCSNFSCRREAFEMAIKKLGLVFDDSLVFSVKSTHLDSFEDMKRLLSSMSLEDLPTAFFACNDIVALGAIRALQAYGIQVPQDISVVGFDDLPHSSLITPSLTTMSVPKIAIGQLSVRVLMEENISRVSIFSQKHSIGGDLIRRGSVKNIS